MPVNRRSIPPSGMAICSSSRSLLLVYLASAVLKDVSWTATASETTIRSPRLWQGTQQSEALLEKMTRDQAFQGEYHNDVAPQESEEENSQETNLFRPRQLLSQPQQQLQQQQQQQNIKAQPWLQEHYPRPDSATCRSTKSYRICDPDGVLSSSGLARIDEYLEQKKYIFRALCTLNAATGGDSNDRERMEGWELQMAVALVEEMDLTPFGPPNNKRREERAAETFARYVHDDWGVGVKTHDCGGAGVLVFLSIRDRAIFISRGQALEATLVDRRLDQVIENMKELLKSQRYEDAILRALEDIRRYVELGPPTMSENATHIFVSIIFPVLWMGGIFGAFVLSAWKERRQKREYAKVRSQLNEIDRARAEALQGKYSVTSCPICLEDFKKPSEEGAVATMGSDGQPIKLLRCGHCMDETCWAEWVNNGRGNVTKCPICQQDIGGDDAIIGGQSHNAIRNHNYNHAQHHQQGIQQRYQDEENRFMRQYRMERNFRLARLGYRYPQIVRQTHVQRWSQPTYDGSLTQDPTFVSSNPSLRTASRTGGGSRSGFGGSSSGGGRGGRW